MLVTGFSAPPRTGDRVAGSYHAEEHPASLTGIFLAISADLGHGTSRLNG